MRRLQLIDPAADNSANDGTSEGAIAGGLKIAFATTDMHRVDAHFGSAPVLMIYEIGLEKHRLLEAIAFDELCDEDGGHADENEDRIEAKVQALTGTVMLFVCAIGGGAAARVVNNRIYPIKLPAPESIASVIARVQGMLRGSPPPWLRKLLAPKPENQLDFVED